ncbi:FAD-dependent oxidoreductase [Sphingobacterium sp.]|uniref:FAD-dependent oxidoreductase n=1 Tax=Sphingobacterium sp. TaxID=341027 RepID=UPI0031DFFCA3
MKGFWNRTSRAKQWFYRIDYYFPIQGTIKVTPYYIERKIDKNVVIISIIMGHYAEKYYKDPVSYQEGMLDEISKLAKRNVRPLLKGLKFKDWKKERFIEGTYSYPMPGEGNARAVASSPLLNKIFFIGEAMNTNHAYGFIHGALETAEQVNNYFNPFLLQACFIPAISVLLSTKKQARL